MPSAPGFLEWLSGDTLARDRHRGIAGAEEPSSTSSRASESSTKRPPATGEGSGRRRRPGRSFRRAREMWAPRQSSSSRASSLDRTGVAPIREEAPSRSGQRLFCVGNHEVRSFESDPRSQIASSPSATGWTTASEYPKSASAWAHASTSSRVASVNSSTDTREASARRGSHTLYTGVWSSWVRSRPSTGPGRGRRRLGSPYRARASRASRRTTALVIRSASPSSSIAIGPR